MLIRQLLVCPLLRLISAAALLVVSSSYAVAAEFEGCVANLASQARAAGVSNAVVEQVLERLELDPKVLKLDRSQPEFAQTFTGYFVARVTDYRITKGREMLSKHRALLARVERETGVPAHYLVAFWGLETNFGSYLGDHWVPSALATLACDQRRAEYFTAEFINALKIVDAGDAKLDSMRGSWAGAMGFVQFMPSNYLRFATDGDGDGKRDLWTSVPDAMASAGRFLQNLGWQPKLLWGREVRLPADFDYALLSEQPRPMREFALAGVTNAFGGPLPKTADILAKLLLPAGHAGPAFLTYHNFEVIMGWNRSQFYALAVGHLADRIKGGAGLRAPMPSGPTKLALADVRSMQLRLVDLGFDTAGVDGRIGPATRRAVAGFQRQAGLIPDGYPDAITLARLDP
jgi:membrane-bound lytic murein transglycosylase B